MPTLHCSLIHMASKFNKYPETNPNYHQFSLLFCDYFLFFATNQIKVILKKINEPESGAYQRACTKRVPLGNQGIRAGYLQSMLSVYHRNATLGDLYQEVILNLWKAYPKFRKECKISTWIYRIALNTCISFIRKEKNVPEIVALTREADWMTEEKDELTEMLRQLYRMINQLGQLDKSIVLLYLEEKSYEEIAEITGLTVTNVATKLSRIKDKLKKMKKEE